MKMMIRLLLILLCLLTGGILEAQPDNTTGKKDVEFKVGAFYNSTLNYYGRTDSLRSSGFFPLAELWFDNHFYVNAAPVFVINKATAFDYAGTVATAGYQAKTENEKFVTHIYFMKPFYRANSQLVQSALKEQLSASFGWQNKFLNLTIGADVKHSNKMDYGLSGGMDHLLRYELPDQMVLVVDPTFMINAGTQEFTKTYYEKKSLLLLPPTEQAVDKQVNRLTILSLEMSAPVILAQNQWQLILIPAYVIPKNLVIVENRPDLSESGRPMFYLTAGAKFIF